MADNKKKQQEENKPAEKKMTKYDMKMKYRKEQEEKAKRNKAISKGIGALVVVAAVAGVAYAGYNAYEAKYGPYIKLGSDDIEETEFNYYYNTAFNTFYNQYGSYASYFGLDVDSPLDEQTYDGDLTWKDYFEQQAVSEMQSVHALKAEGEKAGFEYDTSEDLDSFASSIKEQADSNDMTEDEYCEQAYGEGVTLELAEQYATDASYAGAYYESVQDSFEITDDDIQTYYEENKNDYDFVSYDLCEIEAQIPETDSTVTTTETETETETETLTAEEQAALESEEAEQEAAQEAIKEAAIARAEELADEMLGKITDEASFESLYSDYTTSDSDTCVNDDVEYSSISPTDLADWLYDESRVAGDTTVIEDTDNNTFYVAYFKSRRINDDPTVDVRHILIQAEDVDETDDMTDEEKQAAEDQADADAKAKAEEIYEEWKSGDATEDSFAELADEYSSDTGSNTNGGLYEGVTEGQMVSQFNDWIFDASRQPGDTGIVETSYGYHIMYFVGQDNAEYYNEIKDTLMDDKSEEYLESITADYQPVEKNGTLHYLEVQAEQEATETEAATETETASETETEASK